MLAWVVQCFYLACCQDIKITVRGSHGRERMVFEFTLHMQSVPFTTNTEFESHSGTRCTRYNIM